ncbi:hypothetical protein V6N13_136223 [Hibiscus sabdariffa]|uniref:Uncharacterized protein n=1 Tax=Hibiscus sabdariffa TaxID=183260 RepID=A0ABR2DPQ1_9ROSI
MHRYDEYEHGSTMVEKRMDGAIGSVKILVYDKNTFIGHSRRKKITMLTLDHYISKRQNKAGKEQETHLIEQKAKIVTMAFVTHLWI